jgi:hypothetical protein
MHRDQGQNANQYEEERSGPVADQSWPKKVSLSVELVDHGVMGYSLDVWTPLSCTALFAPARAIFRQPPFTTTARFQLAFSIQLRSIVSLVGYHSNSSLVPAPPMGDRVKKLTNLLSRPLTVPT